MKYTVIVLLAIFDCSVFLAMFLLSQDNSSAIRRKGESETGVTEKQSTSNFPKIKHFLLGNTRTYMCVSGGKKCSFLGKFGVLRFLLTPVLRFALLPTNLLWTFSFWGCLNKKGSRNVPKWRSYKSYMFWS